MADADEGRCMILAHSTAYSLTGFNGVIVNNMDIMLYCGLNLLKIILGQNLCGDVEKNVVHSYFSDKKKKKKKSLDIVILILTTGGRTFPSAAG